MSSKSVYAAFPSDRLTIGAGVAIFHIASERVVVCYHTRDKYWFLPKGRRNTSEDTRVGAEREGFEEVGLSSAVSLHFKIHSRNYSLVIAIEYCLCPCHTDNHPQTGKSNSCS